MLTFNWIFWTWLFTCWHSVSNTAISRWTAPSSCERINNRPWLISTVNKPSSIIFNSCSIYTCMLLCYTILCRGLCMADYHVLCAFTANQALGKPIFHIHLITIIIRIYTSKIWTDARAIIYYCCLIPIHCFSICATNKTINIISNCSFHIKLLLWQFFNIWCPLISK